MDTLLNSLNRAIEQALRPNKLNNLASYLTYDATNLKILLAVSGGIDSICLLDSLFLLQKNHKIAISVAHIHHGLQKNADKWLAFVKQQADARNIPFYSKHLHLKDISSNVEGQAREARYQALIKIAQDTGAHVIATAHHGHDQLETFLLQWFRGAGLAGLSSMPTLKTSTTIPIWRPFLKLLKADIEQYARDRDLPWIEDPSNQSPDFARNRVRKLITQLSSQPQVQPDKLLHSIDVLGQTYQELQALQTIVYQHLLNTSDQLSTQQLNALPAALQKPALRYVLLNWFESHTLNIRQTDWLERVWHVLGSQQPNQWQITNDWLLIYDGTHLYKKAVHSKNTLHHAGQTLTISQEHLNILDQTGKLQLTLTPWKASLHITQNTTNQFALIHKITLETGLFELRVRTGGELIRTHPKRPHKRLKQIWQEQNVSEHARLQAPLLYLNNQLLCVLGSGLNIDHPDVISPPAKSNTADLIHLSIDL